MTVPIMSHYCMAKHSVRVFSDVLRRELYKDEVEVVTIEPTFYRTNIVNFEQINRTREQIYERTPKSIQDAYSQSYVKSLDGMEQLVNMITRSNISEGKISLSSKLRALIKTFLKFKVVDTMEKAVTLVSPKVSLMQTMFDNNKMTTNLNYSNLFVTSITHSHTLPWSFSHFIDAVDFMKC